jgi:hypothetical protein
MSSILTHSQSSEALAGLVALSSLSDGSSRAASPSQSNRGSVMFEYPQGPTDIHTNTTSAMLSLKAVHHRPRAYTEGDAYEIFESFRRPRSNTLSDVDAVGALLSFSSEKGSGNSPRSDEGLKREFNSESTSTSSYVPRARAMSDMSHAVHRLGKLDVDGNGRRSGGTEQQSSGQFPSYQKGQTIGIYSPAARRERLRRFMQKRKKRIWQKRVKYDVRKNFADSRLRFKGRFVKKEDEELMRAAMEIC